MTTPKRKRKSRAKNPNGVKIDAAEMRQKLKEFDARRAKEGKPITQNGACSHYITQL